MSCLLPLVVTLTMGANEDRQDSHDQKKNVPVLKFDKSKIVPPDPKRGKPLARVFSTYLYPDMFGATGTKDKELVKSKKVIARRVGEFIWKTVSDRYIQQNKIQATPKEVKEFLNATGWVSEAPPADFSLLAVRSGFVLLVCPKICRRQYQVLEA